MKRLMLSVWLVVELCGCERRALAPRPTEGKVQAPVDVELSQKEQHAIVRVTFDAPASDVALELRGVDSLRVHSSAITEASFLRGATSTLEAELEGEGTLVVSVNGRFNGVRQMRVVSFTVGQPQRVSAGDHVETPAGTLKVRQSQ